MSPLDATLATTATIYESFSTGMQQRCGIRASARSVESPVEAFLLTRFRPAPKLVARHLDATLATNVTILRIKN